ncbi:MAG: DUF1729 domain-containing protein, partial [Candidatus Ancillula sp.]|nr:DUF1729 domain-containing protein [Candidatus Ancillula sp.]
MSVINELNQGKYALIFGGQGSAWRPIIKELAVGSLEKELEKLNNFVSVALEPVRDQLIVVRPETKDIFSDPSRDKFEDSDAPVSVPGILYSQYLTLRSLMNQGVDVAKFPPVAVEGHSQGVMAKELVEAIKTVDEGERITRLTQIFAIANILGYAAAKMTEDVGIFPEVNATPMVSVKGASRKIIEAVIAKTKDNGGFVNEIAIAIKNDEDHYIISGQASDLEILVQQLEIFAKKYKEMLDAKETGGSELNIQTDFLNVTVPFHSPLLKPALKYVEEWATKCQLDVQLSLELASHVLVNPIDWSASVRSCLTQGAKYFVDLGPTAVVGKLSERLLQGTGAGIIEASNGERLAELVRPGYEPNMLASWESFEPKLVQLPNGKTVVDTAFTRLTGKAPVMLAGMTPTTVEPEIVAAAANAGYWAEVAGGGQVTAEVFNENLSGLEKQLQPGITAQFNSMFLDRYLWNLQFGTTKIVSRARAAGAPLDGVIVTAGIPEKDEAVDLVQTLNKEGFPFVTFKPGTIAQINQVIDIANAVSEYKVIMEIEDGHAGGHHSWESLDDLLLATYPKIRETHNIVLCVGGGIAKPEDATKYLTGEWSIKYTRPKMPVDGVFIGTVAMATKESHATDQVKQLLLETPGISREDVEKGDSWVGSGKSRGQMTSGLSHLRADIYEIDNDSAAAARLIAKYESNADEVESHKNEIIEAINKTAKPYFGDIENMTYLQLVERFAKLCFENVDPKRYEESLVDRFYDILQRIEQRLVDQDSGEFISLFGGVEDVIDYNRAIEQIKQKYPKIATAKVTGIDVAWFIENCRKHPKPVPFVPRVDGD